MREGYEDCSLDVAVLEQAVLDSAKQYFADGIRQSYQESLFGAEIDGEEFEDAEEDMDNSELSDPFDFSDGIHL